MYKKRHNNPSKRRPEETESLTPTEKMIIPLQGEIVEEIGTPQIMINQLMALKRKANTRKPAALVIITIIMEEVIIATVVAEAEVVKILIIGNGGSTITTITGKEITDEIESKGTKAVIVVSTTTTTITTTDMRESSPMSTSAEITKKEATTTGTIMKILGVGTEIKIIGIEITSTATTIATTTW